MIPADGLLMETARFSVPSTSESSRILRLAVAEVWPAGIVI